MKKVKLELGDSVIVEGLEFTMTGFNRVPGTRIPMYKIGFQQVQFASTVAITNVSPAFLNMVSDDIASVVKTAAPTHKPFDLEAAKQGDEIVFQLHSDPREGFKSARYVGPNPTLNGHHFIQYEGMHTQDAVSVPQHLLHMKPRKVTKYVNLYKPTSGERDSGTFYLHDSPEDATFGARDAGTGTLDATKFIAIAVPVEVEV